ncbi:MAG: tetratricopeptide repeat protein [Candidatus Xenobium sp.]
MADDVRDLMREAESLIEERDWDAALEKLKRVLELDPENAKACERLAHAYAVRGMLKSVIQTHFQLMDILEARSELDSAIEVAGWIQRLEPESDVARMRVIQILRKKGDNAEVVRRSRELARLYIELGQGDQSILLLKNAQESDPENLEIGLELAEMFVSHGHIEEGAAQYRRVAVAFQEKGQIEKAAEAYRRMKVIIPDDPGVFFTLGKLFLSLGRFNEAEQEFRAILRHDLNHEEALLALGDVCQKKGQFRDAILAFNKILTINPQENSAKERLGELYQAQGISAEAVKHYLAAAHSWQQLEDHPRAVKLYQRVLALDPTNPTACRELTNLGAPLVPDPGDFAAPAQPASTPESPRSKRGGKSSPGDSLQVGKKRRKGLESPDAAPEAEERVRKGLVRKEGAGSRGLTRKVGAKDKPGLVAAGTQKPVLGRGGTGPRPGLMKPGLGLPGGEKPVLGGKRILRRRLPAEEPPKESVEENVPEIPEVAQQPLPVEEPVAAVVEAPLPVREEPASEFPPQGLDHVVPPPEEATATPRDLAPSGRDSGSEPPPPKAAEVPVPPRPPVLRTLMPVQTPRGELQVPPPVLFMESPDRLEQIREQVVEAPDPEILPWAPLLEVDGDKVREVRQKKLETRDSQVSVEKKSGPIASRFAGAKGGLTFSGGSLLQGLRSPGAQKSRRPSVRAEEVLLELPQAQVATPTGRPPSAAGTLADRIARMRAEKEALDREQSPQPPSPETPPKPPTPAKIRPGTPPPAMRGRKALSGAEAVTPSMTPAPERIPAPQMTPAPERIPSPQVAESGEPPVQEEGPAPSMPSAALEAEPVPPTALEVEPVPPAPVEEMPVPSAALEAGPVPPAPVEEMPVPSAALEVEPVPPAPVEEMPVPSAALEVEPVPPAPVEEMPVPSAELEAGPVPPAPVEEMPVPPTALEVEPVPPAPVEEMPMSPAALEAEPVPPTAVKVKPVSEPVPPPPEEAVAPPVEVPKVEPAVAPEPVEALTVLPESALGGAQPETEPQPVSEEADIFAGPEAAEADLFAGPDLQEPLPAGAVEEELFAGPAPDQATPSAAAQEELLLGAPSVEEPLVGAPSLEEPPTVTEQATPPEVSEPSAESGAPSEAESADVAPETTPEPDVVEPESREVVAPETLCSLAVESEFPPEQIQEACKLREKLGGADITTAIGAYRRVIEESPENLMLRTDLADIHLRYGLLDDAVIQYRQILMRKPESVALRHRLADAYLWNAEYEEAASTFLELAELHLKNDREADAVDILQSVLSLNPNHFLARRRLVDRFSKLGQQNLAVHHLRQLAEIALARGTVEEAIGAFQQLMTLSEDPTFQERLAQVYESQGEVAQALVNYRALANRYREAQMWSEATGATEKLVALDPDNLVDRRSLIELYEKLDRSDRVLESCFELGCRHEDQGAISEASALFEQVLQKDPAYHEARRRLVDCHLRSGDLAAALRDSQPLTELYLETRDTGPGIDLYRRLIQADPRSLDLRRRLLEFYEMAGQQEDVLEQLLVLADLHEASGREREAVQVLQRALEVAPTRDDLHYRLARLYDEKLGSLPGALNEFRKVFELNPGHSEAMDRYARLLMEQRKAREAAEVLNRLVEVQPEAGQASRDRILSEYKERIEADPTDWTTRFVYGEVCYFLDRVEDAVEQFQKTRSDRDHELRSYNMLGLAFARNPRFGLDLAVRQFRRGLETKGHAEQDYLELRYNLAMLLYKNRRFQESLTELKDILAVDVAYRDVGEWVRLLQEEIAGGASGKSPRLPPRRGL